jgi:hypothetical protein
MVIFTMVRGNVIEDANSNVIAVQHSKGPEIINQKAPGGHAPITMKRQEKNMRGFSTSISNPSLFILGSPLKTAQSLAFFNLPHLLRRCFVLGL